ncbi:hypothetical protein CDD83_4075 [Cordyceps sp. RAO-2017]|nr:hypothetical protein CDD83_4075 [Cordyceps sp. RAO-2017]
MAGLTQPTSSSRAHGSHGLVSPPPPTYPQSEEHRQRQPRLEPQERIFRQQEQRREQQEQTHDQRQQRREMWEQRHEPREPDDSSQHHQYLIQQEQKPPPMPEQTHKWQQPAQVWQDHDPHHHHLEQLRRAENGAMDGTGHDEAAKKKVNRNGAYVTLSFILWTLNKLHLSAPPREEWADGWSGGLLISGIVLFFLVSILGVWSVSYVMPRRSGWRPPGYRAVQRLVFRHLGWCSEGKDGKGGLSGRVDDEAGAGQTGHLTRRGHGWAFGL